MNLITKTITLFFIFISINCISQNIKRGRMDTDNDGVIDVIDVDDDNDGIYDIDENRIKSKQIVIWKNSINTKFLNNDLVFNRGYSGWGNSVHSMPFSEMEFVNNYEVSFYVKSAKSLEVGLKLINESHSNSSINYGFSFTSRTFRILRAGESHSEAIKYKSSDRFKVSYNGSELLFYKNEVVVNTAQIKSGLNFSFYASFFGNYQGYGKGHIKDIRIRDLFSDFDIDNDGIINSLDLDSDGDGCYDVLEAGFIDGDGDGILGTGIPNVNGKGKVISSSGYGYRDNDDVELVSDFLDSEINSCSVYSRAMAMGTYGITIDTRDMPEAVFSVLYNDTELLGLISGLEDSEVMIETIEGQDNEVFVNVGKTQNTRALNLKIVQFIDGSLNVQVDYLGAWRPLSKAFYEITENKIRFKNDKSIKLNNPFVLNLENGVYYNRTLPFELVVDENIDLSDASLIIQGPNSLEENISPISNSFNWDGSLAPIGNYKFLLQIQNKRFTGQFIISNN